MTRLAAAVATLRLELDAELVLIRACLAELVADRPTRRRRRGSRRRRWTAAEDEDLRRLYPDTSTAELARSLNRTTMAVYEHAQKAGLHKSEAYMASPAACRLRRGDNVGAAYRFPKGNVPANKGLRRPGWAPGRMAATQFRKGAKPQTWVPVGTEVLDHDGYLKRKVSDDRTVPSRFNWRYVHTLTWEQANGPVPRGHAVAFKNGDKTDIRLENFELVSRQELMRRNSVHNLPPALAEVVQLREALVRAIRRRDRA